jgi:pimeloyl-ACP methyl ester carboxylesterase
VPSLVIQGTTDLQISVEAARHLHRARPESSLAIIPGMNHVLKMAKGGELAQIASYVAPTYAVSNKLAQVITDFVKGL